MPKDDGGWLGRLSGLLGLAGNDAVSIENYRGFLARVALPAVRIAHTDENRRSRLGGLPDLPEGVAWPAWKGRPLAFLCQFDLAELPADCRGLGLPESGVLYFFYDEEQSAWGFDPNDRGAWRVLYAQAPGPHRAVPDGYEESAVYPGCPVAFAKVTTYPDSQDKRLDALNWSDAECEAYYEFRGRAAGGQPAHRFLGHPDPVQNLDMDVECQLASNGIYCGDASGYNDPRAKELAKGRSDWVLLLQLDTDDDAEMMWGDAGTLYYWIRRQDLAARNFADCWMIFQCC